MLMLKPSREAMRRVVVALSEFLDACELLKSDRASGYSQLAVWQDVFGHAARLNDAINDIPLAEWRSPEGWNSRQTISITDIPAQVDSIIGNGRGSSGLREWVHDETGNTRPGDSLTWPTFGDVRYVPFQLSPDRNANIGQLRACVEALNLGDNSTINRLDDVPALLDGGRVVIGGQTIALTHNQSLVMTALVSLGAASLATLATDSGVDQPDKVLRTIIRKHPQLAAFIKTPGGKKGVGYSATIRDDRTANY